MRKSPYVKIKMLLALTLVTAFTILFAFPKMGLAEANNIFVEDYAGILSSEDKSYIKQINENEFINLPGKPQYAVVTLKNLDGYDSVEDYAEKKFQKLGIGNKDLDNGFLFVISIEDRKYRLETGYGVEDVITDSMKEDIVTAEATDLLQDEEYGAAVMLISKNIEQLVNVKYSDPEAAKEYIRQQKEKEAKIVRTIMYIVLGVILFVILIILLYLSGIRKIRKQLNKKYLDKNLSGFIYFNKSSELTGTSKGTRAVNLSQFLAKTIYKMPNKQKLLASDSGMRTWLGQYLLSDSVIKYWCEANKDLAYDVSIYLDEKYLKTLKEELLPKSQTFSYPLKDNPFLSGENMVSIGYYMEETCQKHREALKISKKNKQYIEQVSEHFLDQNRVSLRKVDYQLEVALMVYYFLQEKDLSDPNLLRDIQIDETSLRKAFRFAEKRRKQISSDQKRKALDDLTNMTLGSYYMQAMIWSSYSRSSSSGSGGGGSSFGGGSSGGGGFSGGW